MLGHLWWIVGTYHPIKWNPKYTRSDPKFSDLKFVNKRSRDRKNNREVKPAPAVTLRLTGYVNPYHHHVQGRIHVLADPAPPPPPVFFSLFGGYISQFRHSALSFCKCWIQSCVLSLSWFIGYHRPLWHGLLFLFFQPKKSHLSAKIGIEDVWGVQMRAAGKPWQQARMMRWDFWPWVHGWVGYSGLGEGMYSGMVEDIWGVGYRRKLQ